MENNHDQLNDAERAVLGSMIRENKCIADVVHIVRPNDFRTDAHQTIFGAAVWLWEHSQPVDVITLANKLHAEGKLEDIGRHAYLALLLDAAPTSANAIYYAGIVRERSVLRQLERIGEGIARDARARVGPAEEILADAESKILDVAQLTHDGQTVTLAESVSAVYDLVDARGQGGNGSTGIPTGFLDLDDLTSGLQPSEFVVMAARPSCGKTALSIAIMEHVAVNERLPVFFVSLEQRHTELTERLLCSRGRVNTMHVRKAVMTTDELASFQAAGDQVRSAPVWIDDSPRQTLLRIAANARRLKLRHGVRLVVVDYLQLIEPDERRANRQEQVAGISRRLKQLARELDVPVLALAQLNRDLEGRTDPTPRLSDLRESGSIEADADTVFLLHKPREAEDTVEVLIAKQRNGRTGRFALTFHREVQRFESVADATIFGLPD